MLLAERGRQSTGPEEAVAYAGIQRTGGLRSVAKAQSGQLGVSFEVLDGQRPTRRDGFRSRVAPEGNMLELKHKVRQIIAMKTRGQVTAKTFEGEPLILAKAGVSSSIEADKTDTPEAIKLKHNDYMVDLFMQRQAGDLTKSYPFTSFREQWVKDTDVIRLTREKRLNLEFDFKRRLINPRVITVKDREHIAFDSVPWATIEECDRARAVFDGWRRKRCLKTAEDYEDWEDNYQFALVRDKLQKSKVVDSEVRATNKGIADVLRRMFLRAYSQELCGLVKTMKYIEMADWLTQRGYPTTVDELKNAKRAKFVAHAVPPTTRVMKLAGVLTEGFPTIEIQKFIQFNLKETT